MPTSARRILVLAALVFLLPSGAAAQERGASPPRETTDAQRLGQAWAALAAGRADAAAALASQVLAADRWNPSALTLLVEANLKQGGALAGLTAYERWLGVRTVEAPYLLRRIATVALQEATADRQTLGVRETALRALADDAAGTPGGPAGSSRPGASDEEMATRVNAIIADLNSGRGDRVGLATSLAGIHSPLAIAPLETLLGDGNPMVAAAAAQGLGTLGATDASAKLEALLTQPGQPSVHFAAATALDRLGDDAGTSYLWELLGADHAGVQMDAAEALAARHGADPRWQTRVRALVGDADPLLRVRAARVLMPYDPATAAQVLRALAADRNSAIRDEATSSLADTERDFTALRRLLRGDARARVRAAARILELTR